MRRSLSLLLGAVLAGASPLQATTRNGKVPGAPGSSGLPAANGTPVPELAATQPLTPDLALIPALSETAAASPVPIPPAPVLSAEMLTAADEALLAEIASLQALEDAGRTRRFENGDGHADGNGTPFGERVRRVSEAAADAAQAVAEAPSAGAAQAAADRQFSLLLGETPRSARELAERTAAANAQVEAAMRRALAPFLPGEPEIRSRGSTARGTNAYAETDYDLTVRLPAEWSPEQMQRFLGRKGRLRDIQEALARELGALAEETGARADVRVSRRKGMTRPIPGSPGQVQPDPSAYLLTGEVRDQETGRRLFKVDLLFTNSPAYLNAYPELFAAQMEEVGKAGPEASDRMLAEIRQAKRLFKDAVGAYKSYHGGPSGVGIEQMVLQAGGLEPMLLRVLRAGRTPAGRLRGRIQALRLWSVRNAFFAPPSSFLELLSPRTWSRLLLAAERYFELKAAGRPFTAAELAPSKDMPTRQAAPALLPLLSDGAAPARGGAAEAPGTLTRELLERFTTHGPRPSERGHAFLLAQGAAVLPDDLESPGEEEVFAPAERTGTLRGFLVRFPDGKLAVRPAANTQKRPVPIPEAWGRGTVSGTLIEIEYRKDSTRVRRVGARPQDMIVGRVRRAGGGLTLAPLLSERGRELSLYPDLPVSGSEFDLEEGSIVQAFVDQQEGRLAAVALFDLGRELTPEIAARESAFRRGARGHIPLAVIEQAEARVRADDPGDEFRRMKAAAADLGAWEPVDLRGKPWVTMDPIGAGDLDDAFYIERHPDGGYVWHLATALIGHYVPPGTPAFEEAARLGNSVYSIDKEGLPEYPMNQPAVSKYAASLLAGKDSIAMITTMRFDGDGRLVLGQSGVRLGILRVEGRYTYEQVRDYWAGKGGHGVEHAGQVDLARELKRKLDARDQTRGKLDFEFARPLHRRGPGGWELVVEDKDPVLAESHEVIEQLKVNGNRVIARFLEAITKTERVPHLSRVHPPQDEKRNAELRKQLSAMRLPWPAKESLGDYLERLKGMDGLDERRRQTAMMIALRTRNRAVYAVTDSDGHEGLALKPGEYDHPSAGIRRFADMYNLALLESYLRGESVRAVHERILEDLRRLGFRDLGEFAMHLNERARGSDDIEHEINRFMAVWELAKEKYKGRELTGYVKSVSHSRRTPPKKKKKKAKKGAQAEEKEAPPPPDPSARALIQLDDPYVTIPIEGLQASGLELAEPVTILVREADPAQMRVDFELRRAAD